MSLPDNNITTVAVNTELGSPYSPATNMQVDYLCSPFDLDEYGKSISGKNFLTANPERTLPYVVEALREIKEELDEIKAQL